MMKKILALLVVLSMVFCFVACGPEADPTPENNACTDHVDDDGNGICDTPGCGATVNNGGGNGGDTPVTITPEAAAAYVNAIWGAVENAKTVTATIDMTSTQAQTDVVDKTGKVMEDAFSETMTVHFDLTLAMGENGLNLKVTGNATMDEETQEMEGYIVDGVAYVRTMEDNEWGEWDVSPVEIPEEVTGTISQFAAIVAELLPEDFEITADMIAEIKGVIASAVTAIMTVNEDGSFGAKADAKPVIDAVVEFITAIETDDTIGEVINNVLAIVDPEMTIEAILDGIGTYGSVTVGEIYDGLDAALVEEYGMGINDIKNAVLAEESITAMLIATGAMSEEDLADLVEMDIDAMVQEYAEMTIDDVLYQIVMATPSEPEDDGNDGTEPMSEGEDIKALAEELVGDGAALVEIPVTGDYVQTVYADENGLGYVVHVVVISQNYGTVETETLVYINADGEIAGVNKLVWKTSDAIYGYVPPTADVVDAFYAKLTGKNAEEFKAAFTGEDVELVSNATNTSTNLVNSIIEAFDVVEAIENGEMDAVGTLAAMMERAKAMLATTVGDIIGEQYDVIMDTLKSIDMRANYSYITFKLGTDLSIEKIEIGEKIDFSVTTPTVQYEKVENEEGPNEKVPVECTVTVTMKLETVYTITSVSNVSTTITAPEVEVAE